MAYVLLIGGFRADIVQWRFDINTPQTSEEEMSVFKNVASIAEIYVQRALEDRHNFKNVTLCFECFHEYTFCCALDEGFDDESVNIVTDYFAELFDAQFGTNFSQ